MDTGITVHDLLQIAADYGYTEHIYRHNGKWHYNGIQLQNANQDDEGFIIDEYDQRVYILFLSGICNGEFVKGTAII